MSEPRTPTKSSVLSGTELQQAATAYEAELHERVIDEQRGITTFFDSAVRDLLGILKRLPDSVPWERSLETAPLRGNQRRLLQEAFGLFRAFLDRRRQGRFVELHARQAEPGSEIHPLVWKMSQGTSACLTWGGKPLFKSVFDFALYPQVIGDLRPRTIFEIGSGTGASAAWLSDLVRVMELDTTIYSLDLVRPDLELENVRFLEGDCNRIASAIGAEILEAAPHPWLVIEDAHVNVLGVLMHLGAATRLGDYFIVEDSKGKERELAAFCERSPGSYRVDTHYTDFFGKNSTTAHDSILRRMDG